MAVAGPNDPFINELNSEPFLVFQNTPSGASILINDGDYWNPLRRRCMVSFFFRGNHVITLQFHEWEDAGREYGYFLRRPEHWIQMHFTMDPTDNDEDEEDDVQTINWANRVTPHRPRFRPTTACVVVPSPFDLAWERAQDVAP
jgi:hypothetical protein